MPVTALTTPPVADLSAKGAAANNISDALALFNSASTQLADNYHEMEQRVDSLSEELHQVAEQRLQELQEKERLSDHLESLLNVLPSGVIVIDNRGRIRDCNPAAITFLGEPLIGELWRDVISKNFSPRGDDGHEISLKDGRRVSLATRSLEKDGGQLIVLTDMTETRELQRNLSRHKRLSDMGRMMSSLAHQIRTPLSAAMLYAGHLCDSELSKEQSQRFSAKILSRLNHLEQQVKDMLIFVRGDVKLTDATSMQQLMADLETSIEVVMDSAQASYELHNHCPELQVQCNRESMLGALVNLVNNGVQAVERQPAHLLIEVTQASADSISIAIIDNGPGISEQALANLEEPFYTTKPQGTGLGLAVVRAVAQAHHGQFSLRSEPNGGCRATVTLPLLASPAAGVAL
ncbi:ATP-binding protein [Dasania sp. GY-MA-18]|uniref:histidine kinase n=1 Tax=Dasania phycosphaerae TaxID=2950436 RepID=A0A9J6RHI0_9GAMM|nr:MULTISPECIES: ATP-binding protein [Dasania]MCR8921365.1 ATP-binding protein [Dasania sp. GY-MA-18]MCZ0863793.1 ATP-binding protein [Dasania phycosphaerae]MCZ0867521.1 ATP-binding protein [Dasania phycosphaerae]